MAAKSEPRLGSADPVDLDQVRERFERLPEDRAPRPLGYSWQDVYAGAMGPGGLFLMHDMAEATGLTQGARVLDLGCGRAASSLFLAREYRVRVWAADLWIDPTANLSRVRAAGAEDDVYPLRVEARELPFGHGYFDAILCMDAFFYFGTDSFYLPYLAKFLKPGGRLCVASPCFAREIRPEERELFWFSDAEGYHSPPWWRDHLTAPGAVRIVSCEELGHGRALWDDFVRFRAEHADGDPDRIAEWQEDAELLTQDRERLLTHFLLIAEKPPESSAHGATG